MSPDPSALPGRLSRARHWWHDDVDRWMKVVITLVACATGLYTASGWLDGGLSWYLQRSALAGDIQQLRKDTRSLERKVDAGQRLILQDQEIRYGREIRDLERAEREGRLSRAEQSWLDVLRDQRREVQEQLRKIPKNP